MKLRRQIHSVVTGAVVAVAIALCILASPVVAAEAPPPISCSNLSQAPRSPSTYVDARVLATDTAETVTVASFAKEPDKSVLLVFSANCADFSLRSGGTAAVPSADVTDGTSSERNPAYLKFSQAATFSLVAPTACKVTMSYYVLVGC